MANPDSVDIEKILDDVYQLGRTDALLDTNDYTELKPSVLKKINGNTTPVDIGEVGSLEQLLDYCKLPYAHKKSIMALFKAELDSAVTKAYKQGYIDGGVFGLTNMKGWEQWLWGTLE